MLGKRHLALALLIRGTETFPMSMCFRYSILAIKTAQKIRSIIHHPILKANIAYVLHIGIFLELVLEPRAIVLISFSISKHKRVFPLLLLTEVFSNGGCGQ